MTKPIIWNNGADRNFKKKFDEDGQDVFNFALSEIAEGKELLPESGIDDDRHGHPFGNHVRKLKWDDDNNSTWRVVYVREYEEAIYVVNAYQKKSKKGSAEPKENVEATKTRLTWAEGEHEKHLKKKAAEEKANPGQKAKTTKRKGGK